MIAVLKNGTTPAQTHHLVEWLKTMNLDVHISEGAHVTVLGLIGDTSRVDMELLSSLEIVQSVKRVSEPYKQANRKFHPNDTIVQIGDVKIGGGSVVLKEVPDGCTVVGIPGTIVKRHGKPHTEDMNQVDLPDPIAVEIECLRKRIVALENLLKAEYEDLSLCADCAGGSDDMPDAAAAGCTQCGDCVECGIVSSVLAAEKEIHGEITGGNTSEDL